MKLSAQELALLEVAALFHDTGYALAYAGHEEQSAAQARAFLLKAKASAADITRVHGLIMATRLSATPRGTLQQVLRDADSAKAGQVDFIEKSELLRKELETVQGKKITAPAWLAQNLAYLEKHTFFTKYARDRYTKQKRINLRALRQRSATPKRERAPLPHLRERFFDRDLSWLSFNDRVLQEAQDARCV